MVQRADPTAPARTLARTPVLRLDRTVTIAVAAAVALGVSACSSAGGSRSANVSTPATSAPVASITTARPQSATGPTGSQPAPSGAGSSQAAGTSPSAGNPPAVPAGGAYLGAWINPAGPAGVGPAGELAQLPAFEQATASHPAIIGLYAGFQSPAPMAALEAISAAGAIPLLAWSCAPVGAVSSGVYDSTVRNYALSLKSLGHPIFLRWFWEMNLPTRSSSSCLGTDGAPGFVQAWIHIWSIFHEVGATNVAFVWCPGVGGTAPFTPFFPGTAYVDWIAADGYDRHHLGAEGFATVFAAWYDTYASSSKPLMVAETGATASDQSQYVGGLAQTLPSSFPAVKAVVYFDADGPNGNWSLTPAGLAAFKMVASAQYFSA
ncbi:MAG: hypothetical protein KGQ66_05415 [Acidobacteriota bacterium]|nr:hypothetical protein [Acidobacteriota bacterium]